jgi:hypothetical protein
MFKVVIILLLCLITLQLKYIVYDDGTILDRMLRPVKPTPKDYMRSSIIKLKRPRRNWGRLGRKTMYWNHEQ